MRVLRYTDLERLQNKLPSQAVLAFAGSLPDTLFRWLNVQNGIPMYEVAPCRRAPCCRAHHPQRWLHLASTTSCGLALSQFQSASRQRMLPRTRSCIARLTMGGPFLHDSFIVSPVQTPEGGKTLALCCRRQPYHTPRCSRYTTSVHKVYNKPLKVQSGA